MFAGNGLARHLCAHLCLFLSCRAYTATVIFVVRLHAIFTVLRPLTAAAQGWKVFRKTSFRKASTMDFHSDLDSLAAYEEAYARVLEERVGRPFPSSN